MNTWLIVFLIISSIAAIAILCALAISKESTGESGHMAEEPLSTEEKVPESTPRPPTISAR